MSLKDQTIDAILWVSVAKSVSQVFSWSVTIFLARLLSPIEFGLISMAWLFLSFLDLINELGIGAAIIQKSDLSNEDLHSTFWMAIVSGLFFYLVTFLVAPWVATFFNNSELSLVLRVLGCIFVIGAFKVIPFNLLKKTLSFRELSIAELVSVLCGAMISVPLALWGYGVFSLIYGQIVQNLVLSATIFYVCPWRPKPLFLVEKLSAIFNMGISVTGSRVLWYFYSSSDSAVIGKFLGQQSLGYYSMARDLSTLPMQKVTAIINQVAFPVFSKLKDDPENLRTYFLKITRFLSLLTFPSMVGLFLVSDSLIEVVLSEKWLPMLIPVKILCFVGLLQSLDPIFPSILVAKNRTDIVIRYSTINFIVLPLSFFVGSYFGLNGVSAALAIVYPFLSFYLCRRGLKELGIPLFNYVRNLLPAIAASTLMAMMVVGFQFGDRVIYGGSIHFTLIGSSLLGIISYFAFLTLLHGDVVIEIRGILRSLQTRVLQNRAC